jgi:hypothetical protein
MLDRRKSDRYTLRVVWKVGGREAASGPQKIEPTVPSLGAEYAVRRGYEQGGTTART